MSLTVGGKLKKLQFNKNLGQLSVCGIEMFFEELLDESYHVVVHLESSVHRYGYVRFTHRYVQPALNIWYACVSNT